MVRLTRAQQQARTRAAVLAAAREEFVEYGYTAAKVDRIAERAELTRGAVYSNFPGKRALYLAVLVELVERTGSPPAVEEPGSAGEALGAFARVWLARLPLVDDPAAGGRLQLRSLAGVIEDDAGRAVLAQTARLEALLLALMLESRAPEQPPTRRVRLAELALTLLGGSGLIAELAPGFGDPFDRARACEHLASLDFGDVWAPAYLPYIAPAARVEQAWTPPAEAGAPFTADAVDLAADGVVVVLGAGRLEAAEEAVRSARPGEQLTVVIVTDDPANTGRLVRLRVGDLLACLRQVSPSPLPDHLHLVLDDDARVAAAAGLAAVDDSTEAAVRISGNAVVARAEGRGAAYAVVKAETARTGGATT
ncbi:TetR/AcrR family transcriptional regulator [Amycolatopsis regifaucium]|uniref:Transcriptional regulator n=1 Tax=Amycolatopsis regifaucium TaxID=546365 RepID=A0A154MK06_9PSEU|nr:TetR/AcrR family transcriptional regulator [Amycolatopsis regifaucium]KZB84681.1 transcriptional regulator [Amycolatopsis regifaucium]OKA11147.1 TetR family transcriptional regulator [Amycolatopsis regifaucium]SFI30081.1 DNA-binding transcriptional regulator, AcrR family [Amycolatopsis regifaucium]